MTCGIALNIGSIVCSCVSTQKGTILKAILVDFLNLLKRKCYRHNLSLCVCLCVCVCVCVCVGPRIIHIFLFCCKGHFSHIPAYTHFFSFHVHQLNFYQFPISFRASNMEFVFLNLTPRSLVNMCQEFVK